MYTVHPYGDIWKQSGSPLSLASYLNSYGMELELGLLLGTAIPRHSTVNASCQSKLRSIIVICNMASRMMIQVQINVDGDIPIVSPYIPTVARDISPKGSRIGTFGITIHQMKNDHVIRNAKNILEDSKVHKVHIRREFWMCIFRDSSRSLTWYLHYFTFRYLYIFYIHPTAFILQFQVLFFFWECLVLCSTSGCFFLLVAAHVCMYIRRACHMIYIYYYTYIYIYKHPKNRKVVHHYFSRICIYIYISYSFSC